MRVLLVSANREMLPSPVVPLGLLTVAGTVRESHDVRIVDLCFETDPQASLEQATREYQPDVVGIGIRNLHTNAYDGTESLMIYFTGLVAAIRRATRAPIVMGGSGFSLQPNIILDRTGADYGVVGEGERAFRTLLETIGRGETPPRLSYAEIAAQHATGSPISLRRGPQVSSDLDLLAPPARDLVDPRYYEFDGTDNIQTKRGCAFQCNYCDYPDLEGRKVRVRNPEAIADEMVARSKVPGVTHAFFVDSVFNVPKSHALAICRALIERGNPMPWVCYGTPAAFDDELVAAMVASGCQGVEVGSDSGTARGLELLRKPFDLADVIKTRELFLKHNLLDCHTYVLGFADETMEDVHETLNFVEKLNPDIAVFIAFMEDRETLAVGRARHRDAILELLGREAPKHPGWVCPELGIRFGNKVTNLVNNTGWRGPSWLQYAKMRRHQALRAMRQAGTSTQDPGVAPTVMPPRTQ